MLTHIARLRGVVTGCTRRFAGTSIGAHVAAQLSQLPLDLGAVWEREVRHGVGEIVEAVDLAQERRPPLDVQTGDELADRLGAVSGSVVDRLKPAHATRPICRISWDTPKGYDQMRRFVITRIPGETGTWPKSEARASLLPLAPRTRLRTQLVGFDGTQRISPCLRALPGPVRPLRVAHHHPRVGGSSPSSGIPIPLPRANFCGHPPNPQVYTENPHVAGASPPLEGCDPPSQSQIC